jgi:queuine tRNA-ribosyltransferase
MGIGDPEGVIEAIAAGVDMFDCVLPTRLGRTGSALVDGGRINLRNAAHAEDERPLQEGCTCVACTTYSRAYIRHLVTQEEIVGLRLLTLHNLHVVFELVRGAREAIRAGTFSEYRLSRLSPP